MLKQYTLLGLVAAEPAVGQVNVLVATIREHVKEDIAPEDEKSKMLAKILGHRSNPENGINPIVLTTITQLQVFTDDICQRLSHAAHQLENKMNFRLKDMPIVAMFLKAAVEANEVLEALRMHAGVIGRMPSGRTFIIGFDNFVCEHFHIGKVWLSGMLIDPRDYTGNEETIQHYAETREMTKDELMAAQAMIAEGSLFDTIADFYGEAGVIDASCDRDAEEQDAYAKEHYAANVSGTAGNYDGDIDANSEHTYNPNAGEVDGSKIVQMNGAREYTPEVDAVGEIHDAYTPEDNEPEGDIPGDAKIEQ